MKDYRDIILRPVITEKSMKLMADDNKVTFKVAPTANKIEVRNAVEKLFNVKVTNVNILNTADKKKRVGRHTGVVRGFKKAVVTLAEGSSINLSAKSKTGRRRYFLYKHCVTGGTKGHAYQEI